MWASAHTPIAVYYTRRVQWLKHGLQPDFRALRRLQEGSNLRIDGRFPIFEDVMTVLLMQLHLGIRKDLTPTLKEVHIEAEIFAAPDNLHWLSGEL